MLNALKTIGRVALIPLKQGAVKILWPVVRDHLWDIVVPLLGYTLKHTILKRSEDMKNQMEALVRGIVEAIKNSPGASVIDIIGMIKDVFGPIMAVWDLFSNADSATKRAEFKAAFDALVGSEPDAIIGPGQMVNTGVGWLTEEQQEQISDIIGDIIADALFPDDTTPE